LVVAVSVANPADHAGATGAAGSVPAGAARAGPALERTPTEPDEAAAGPRLEPTAGSTPRLAKRKIGRLIDQLDATDFRSRNDATRQLLSQGSGAIPQLVVALGEPSRELQYRAGVLLRDHHSFEEVAPHLVGALDRPYGPRARAILRERASRQITDACRPPHAQELFKFSGTSLEAFCDQTLTELADAKTREQTVRAVRPLLGLCDRTMRFGDAVSRLESLSLPYDRQHSPGYVIAHTLARGSVTHHLAWIDFAQRYLEALETLASELRKQDHPPHAIRKEVSERASASQGAAGYLVQVLDEGSPDRALLSARIGISPGRLQDAFCCGVSAVDPKNYYRGVGTVHIVEMLADALRQWPDAPRDGVVAELIAGVKKTAGVGDKPKALSYLDALDACRTLAAHQLDLKEGLGQRLAERLCLAAQQTPNNRVYYPARIVHDRIVSLIDAGVGPPHPAYPGQMIEDYLQGSDAATSDARRLALERYLRILQRLKKAGLSLEQAGVRRFALAMRDQLAVNPQLLGAGAKALDRLLPEHSGRLEHVGTRIVDRQLGQWCRDHL
jgi:hypothetical protein